MPYEPRLDERKSGRVLVRMPISMHKALSEIARGEGISMNQFICGVLAVAVDWRSEFKPQRPVEEIHNDVGSLG
jgi:antitoxin HicB